MRQNALLRSGTGLEFPSTTRKSVAPVSVIAPAPVEERHDHFVVRNGVRCAGVHLIVDLHGAEGLNDIDLIERTLRRCVDAAGATLLHIHLHHFQPNGVSGWRCWPRVTSRSTPGLTPATPRSMCSCAATPIPHACIPLLREAFKAERVEVNELLRGQGA